MTQWTLQHASEIADGISYKVHSYHIIDNLTLMESDIQDHLSLILATSQTVTGPVTWSAAQTYNGSVTFNTTTTLAGNTTTSARFNVGQASTGSLTTAGDFIYDTTTGEGLFKGYVVGTTPGIVPFQYAAGVNAQTGTSYTVVTADRFKLITSSTAAAMAITLPQAGSTGFKSNFVFSVSNQNTGTVTITPTTSTIDGAASLKLLQNQGIMIWSDGANYFTNRGVNGGLDLLATATAASSATLAFTTNINSTYAEYLIVGVGIQPSSNTVDFFAQVSEDSGNTWKSGAGSYTYSNAFSTGTGALSQNGTTDTKIGFGQVGAGTGTTNNAAEALNFQLHIHNPSSTALNKYFNGAFVYTNASASNLTQGTLGAKYTGDTAAINAIQFFFSSGNILIGNFYLYGLRKI